MRLGLPAPLQPSRQFQRGVLEPLEPLQAAWTCHLCRRWFCPSRARARLSTAERHATVGRDGVKEDSRPPQSLFTQRQENALASFDDGLHFVCVPSTLRLTASMLALNPTLPGNDCQTRPCPPLPFHEQPCLLGPVLLGQSVGAVPQYLNHGEVSLHSVHSGKTHESRAMNARPSRASADASASLGSAASASTLPTISASSLARATASGMAGRFTPCPRRRPRRLQRQPVAGWNVGSGSGRLPGRCQDARREDHGRWGVAMGPTVIHQLGTSATAERPQPGPPPAVIARWMLESSLAPPRHTAGAGG